MLKTATASDLFRFFSFFFLCPIQEQKSDSEPPSPPAQPSTCCSYGALKSILGIVATAVLLLGVSRTVMLVVLTYHLHDINSTQINSSHCAEIAAELDHNSTYYQATDLLYVFYSFLNWLEYATLAHGVYNLLVKTSNTTEQTGRAASSNPDPRADLENAIHSDVNQRPSLYPRTDLKNLFKKVRENKEKHYKVLLGTPLAIVFIIIYTLASLAIPIVGIIRAYTANKCYTDHKEQQIILTSHLAYQSLTIVAHIVNVTIRGAMIIVVLEVRAIWFNKHRIDNVADKLPNTTDARYCKCIISYEKRVSKLKPLLRVFQTWFVFQWFHYFFQAVTNLTRFLLPILTGISHPELIITYRGIYTVYDILAFAIPHVCGLKMNAYHEKYLRDERKRLLDAAPSEEFVKAYSLKVEKKKVRGICAWDTNDRHKNTTRQSRLHHGNFLNNFDTNNNIYTGKLQSI